MSFENYETYRRKPVTVHAVRLTAEGNIPITHTDAPWIKQLIADKRLQWGGQNWWVNTGETSVAVAYAGSWIVSHDAERRLDVMSDETFRELFEQHDVKEDA